MEILKLTKQPQPLNQKIVAYPVYTLPLNFRHKSRSFLIYDGHTFFGLVAVCRLADGQGEQKKILKVHSE